MNPKLFETLADRGIINGDTFLTAKVRNQDVSGISRIKFSGNFQYLVHVDDGDRIAIMGKSADGRTITFYPEDIQEIDGMEIRRIACIYALDEEGESVSQARRRGRKPKNRVAA